MGKTIRIRSLLSLLALFILPGIASACEIARGLVTQRGGTPGIYLCSFQDDGGMIEIWRICQTGVTFGVFR